MVVGLRRMGSLGGCLALAVLVTTGCGVVSSGGSADYPDYPSVEDMTQAADIVVVGTIGERIDEEVDRGVNTEGSAGIPMKFHEVKVSEVLVGDVGGTIVLAWVDLDKSPEEGLSDVLPGQETVLFLEHRTSAEAPGITTQDDFYVPIGGHNGVMDVVKGVVTARSQAVTALTAAELQDEAAQRLATDDELFQASRNEVSNTVETSAQR